LAYVIEFN